MQKINLFTIFYVFLKLGLTSFGGPAAHLNIFRRVFVQEKAWLTSHDYQHLIALTQLLPGPSSSQVGIAIGYLKHGYLGSVCAWVGFTLPSALIMMSLAIFDFQFFQFLQQPKSISAIQIIVLTLISFAFWQMLRSFCQFTWQYLLMLLSCALLLFPLAINPFFIIVLSGCIGLLIYHTQSIKTAKIDWKMFKNNKTGLLWLLVFFSTFLALFILKITQANMLNQSIFGFYSTGSMVFGGGHVVLPLLHQEFVETGLIETHRFEMGYAFAQLMPGPLFSFASYLGALLPITASPVVNSVIATVFIFLPSFFLIFACLKYWSLLISNQRIQFIVFAINAAVVGLLLATVIPMGMLSLNSFKDALCAILLFILLKLNISIFISFPLIFVLYFYF